MVGDRLRELREKENLSQTALAKKLKIPNQNVSNYERGFRKPDYETLQIFANFFGVSRAYILGDTDNPRDYMQQDNIFPPPEGNHVVPLLGEIRAGLPMDRIENVERYIVVDKNMVGSDETFALKVKGNSMSGDKIFDGHIVICVKQSEVNRRDVAVVAVGDEEATLKHVRRIGDVCILEPSNPEYDEQEVSADRITVLGKVVTYWGETP